MVNKDGQEEGFQNSSKFKFRVHFGLWLVLGFKVGLGLRHRFRVRFRVRFRIVVSA